MRNEFNWSLLNAEELMWLNEAYYAGELNYEEAMMYERMNVDYYLMNQMPMPAVPMPVVAPMNQPVAMPRVTNAAAVGNMENMTADELLSLVAQRNKLAEKLIKLRLKDAKKRAKLATNVSAGGNLENMTADELLSHVAQRNKLAEKLVILRLKDAKKKAKLIR